MTVNQAAEDWFKVFGVKLRLQTGHVWLIKRADGGIYCDRCKRDIPGPELWTSRCQP